MKIVLTGGPCGGKSCLIEALRMQPGWRGRVLALPGAIFAAGQTGISPTEPLFQRLVVEGQRGLEDALECCLEPGDGRLMLCHRGSLDPLAYWLARGWQEEEFFEFTRTTWQEHYRRYDAVIHLVTAADGASQAYRRYPEAHRHETPDEAVEIDRLLQRVWERHPAYYLIDNAGKDWEAKQDAALRILALFTRS
jgi:predicted ATPase